MPGRAEETAQEESRQQEPLQIWRQGDAGESVLLFKFQQTKLFMPKMKILSLFIYPHIIPNTYDHLLCNTNGDVLKNVIVHVFQKIQTSHLKLYNMT